jgi:GNAT superfamily N-acetyltransferase
MSRADARSGSGSTTTNTPVGFVMLSDEVAGPDYIAHYLWKLLIDRDRQRQGYGHRSVWISSRRTSRDRGNTEMWTSAGQGEGSPIPFYERYGFVRDRQARCSTKRCSSAWTSRPTGTPRA